MELDQFRQTFNPELDVAEEFSREILRPQLALAQVFPLFGPGVRPAVTPDQTPQMHRLFRGNLPIFPLAEWQILTPNDAPEPSWPVFRLRQVLVLRDVTLRCVREGPFRRFQFLNPSSGQVVRELIGADYIKPVSRNPVPQ